MRRFMMAMAILTTLFLGCAQEESPQEKSLTEQFGLLQPSGQKLNNQELTIVNKAAYAYIQKVALSPVDKLQFAAYLANAQQKFALISEELNGVPKGSFAPVTIAIVRLFDPTANIIQLQSRFYDEQTIAIADYVAAQFQDRLYDEKARVHPYSVQIGPEKWFSNQGYFGITFGSMTPWFLAKCDQYRCPPPKLDPLSLDAQSSTVLECMKDNTATKIEIIHYWADKGDWEEIAEAYMSAQDIPLMKRLEVRAVLLSALSDATGAAFDSKYTYWVKRPGQITSKIHPVIPAPNHPSYPSGHSTIGKTAAVVLSHYFPENSEQWNASALEAGLSRIWAGIHYPMDHDAGVELGKRVGEQALQNSTQRR